MADTTEQALVRSFTNAFPNLNTAYQIYVDRNRRSLTLMSFDKFQNIAVQLPKVPTEEEDSRLPQVLTVLKFHGIGESQFGPLGAEYAKAVALDIIKALS